MSEDTHWIDRAQTAEAQLAALKEAYKPALDRIKEFKTNFGIKERADGQIDIDFEKLVERLGRSGALELRALIDERYQITGKAGEKPHVRLAHGR